MHFSVDFSAQQSPNIGDLSGFFFLGRIVCRKCFFKPSRKMLRAFFIESSQNWAERCAMKRGAVGGCNFIVWKNMQIRKGAQRRSLAVIDLGECRVAVDVELNDFLVA